MFNNFKSAHVVIFKDNKILILKRSSTDEWMPDHYGLPGGKLNTDETPEQAACRECKEETNLEVSTSDLILLSKISNNKEHAFYYTTKFNGILKLDFEHSDFKWVELNNLSRYKVVPDLPDIAKEAFIKMELNNGKNQ